MCLGFQTSLYAEKDSGNLHKVVNKIRLVSVRTTITYNCTKGAWIRF